TDFIDAYRPDMPGCLIVDLSMPGMSGMDLLQNLRSRNIQIPTLIVSGTGTIPMVVEGMKMGVVDFLEKPADPTVLLQKVRAALELDNRQRTQAAELEPITRKLASLTSRERQLLKLLVRGLSSKQVAAELNISVKTVENHRANLMQKTGALNAADLTRMAMLVDQVPTG
ncbi:MAG TPA: LuxR C-terminal-related transcriptional regulator, partial [Tepidisphaeraceae bacterium]